MLPVWLSKGHVSCWCIFPWPTHSLHFSCLFFCFTRTWASPWLLLLYHPLPSMLLAAEGEGDEDEFGRQREQAEEMSHSHRNGMQVGSEPPYFHKPPGYSFFLQKKMWLGFQPGHPLPAEKMGLDLPGVKGILFMASLSASTMPSYFPGQGNK